MSHRYRSHFERSSAVASHRNLTGGEIILAALHREPSDSFAAIPAGWVRTARERDRSREAIMANEYSKRKGTDTWLWCGE